MIKRNLKIFWIFSLISIKITFFYKIGIIFFTLGKIIRFVVFFLFIYFLVSKTKFLAGYTQTQAMIFFLTFNFIDSLTQLLFREVYRFRPLVISGELDGILLKPYHPFLRILIGGIDILDAFLTIPYTLLLIYFLNQLNPSLINIFYYLIFLVNSLVIATAFHIAVLALGVFTAEIDHAMLIYRDLIKMSALSTDIYQEPLRTFLTFFIPIGLMMTIPVKSLLGLINLQTAVLSILISVIFLIFSLYLWQMALKKYQSASS